MELKHTQTLINKKALGRDLDSCAIFASVRGEKAVAFSEDVNVDTLFDIASMGKILVTTPLVLKAVGDGQVSLDSKLDQFFEDVPKDKKQITVRQLLTHTSGIVRYEWPVEVGQAGHKSVLRYILDSKLSYAPGTQYIYSCNGMMLLGFILETIYDKQLDAIWLEQMKLPLGLTRSAFNIPLDSENAAVSYHWKNPGTSRLDDVNIRSIGGVGGAGGMFWSLRDIVTYCEAVLQKQSLLYADFLFEEAERDYTPFGSCGRGLGWTMVDERYRQTGKLFTKGSFGHTGWTGTSLFIDRKMDMFVILLTNSTRALYVQKEFSGVTGEDVENHTHKTRMDLHNEVYRDLKENGIL